MLKNTLRTLVHSVFDKYGKKKNKLRSSYVGHLPPALNSILHIAGLSVVLMIIYMIWKCQKPPITDGWHEAEALFSSTLMVVFEHARKYTIMYKYI